MRWPDTAAMVALAVLLAGCGAADQPAAAPTTTATVSTSASSTTSSSAPPTSTSATTTSPTTSATTTAPAPSTGTIVTTADSAFGEMLFDSTGQAIYLFALEATDEAECYGDCAVAWPPVLTEGMPQADGGTRPALLGTTQRDDGTTQVTYAGHPLYFYAHEGKDEVLCHNVSEFGGLWLVVTPEGDPAPA